MFKMCWQACSVNFYFLPSCLFRLEFDVLYLKSVLLIPSCPTHTPESRKNYIQTRKYRRESKHSGIIGKQESPPHSFYPRPAPSRLRRLRSLRRQGLQAHALLLRYRPPGRAPTARIRHVAQGGWLRGVHWSSRRRLSFPP